MSEPPVCLECASELTYEMGDLQARCMCAHVWTAGDTVIIVKTLRVEGNPSDIEVGAKVRNIRPVHGNGDHDIDCKVDGFGPIMLKSSVVKKA